jgi:hypothetical protein
VGFILEIHGLVRWLVALLALVAIVKFAIGWLQKRPYTAADRGIMSAYTSLVDMNLLLGLILFFGLGGGFPMARIEHASTMIVAVVVAHLSAIWRKSDDAAKKFRNNLIVVVVSIILIVTAVIQLRGGWIFG